MVPLQLFASFLFLPLLVAAHETGVSDTLPPVTVGGLKEVKEQLLMVAKMPEESQKALLSVLGAGLAASGQLECNLFGGEAACVDIPRNSQFSQTCAVANMQVDCAFKNEALEQISKDPHVVMREKLAKEGFPPCDSCFAALHEFWCGQTVPACGTFEEVLDEILPVISETANGRANPVDALPKAFPKLLQAFSLGLPCREMCEAITASCSCGRSRTFGEVMSILEKKNQDTIDGGLAEFSTNMSASTAKQLFASVWDKPVCTLFAPKSLPGFKGVCEVPATALARCGWCKSKVRGPQDAEEQIVAQLAESISGMMQSGLQRILDAASSAAHGGHSQREGWNWEERHQQQPKSSGWGTFWAVFLVLLAAGGGAAAAALYVQHRRRHGPSQYMDLHSMGYNPPVL